MSHGHSHGGGGGGRGRQSRQSTINTLVATDDNENDQRLGTAGGTISIMSPATDPAADTAGGASAAAGGAHSHNSNKKRATADSMNMRGVFLHVLSDALGKCCLLLAQAGAVVTFG